MEDKSKSNSPLAIPSYNLTRELYFVYLQVNTFAMYAATCLIHSVICATAVSLVPISIYARIVIRAKRFLIHIH